MPRSLELMEGITIGADPELFIRDKNTGEFICPDGLIPGTKEEPYKVDGGAVQQDGFAAEFNIDPCSTYSDFSYNIKKVRGQLQKMLPKHLELVAVPTAEFSQAEWDRASDVTKMLGCSPDYNAWNLNVNPTPKAEDRVRCAGGHLHFGWTEDADISDAAYFKAAVDLVRQLDWWLGGWSVSQDLDKLRRAMYGKAGSMRFKPYGVEYRTLSNFWLRNPAQIQAVWNRVCRAIDMMKTTYYPEKYAEYNVSLITAINKSDQSQTVLRHPAFSTPIKSIAI